MNELPQISACTTNSVDYDLATLTSGNTSLTARWIQDPQMFQRQPHQPQIESNSDMSNRRIVQVFIADSNENVPLDKSLLYQDEKLRLTDLTDQELFFDIDIKSVLEKHNAYRVSMVDKDASEGKNKDVMLEPAKIRDLKMTVVCVAAF